MCPSPRSHHVIFNTCSFANRQLALLLNRLFYSMPPVDNHRWGSSRLIRAPVLAVDLLTSLGVTPPPCPVTPAEYLPNQPYGAHADSNRIVNMQLYVICKSFYGCSASMLINGDVEALEDDRLLRLMAPQATKLLDKWPTKPADFLEKKDDATL